MHSLTQQTDTLLAEIKKLYNKGDLRIYEIRYRWLNELFISQYSFIYLNISHISVLFRYANPCICISFYGSLVRNWCGVWEVDIWKRVHHDKSEKFSDDLKGTV